MTHRRTVLITGAAGGIGRAIVAEFQRQGWQVIGWDRVPYPESYPKPGWFQQVDVADPAAVDAALQRVRAHVDRLHALVNNAAIQIAKPLLETTLQDWDTVQAVNVRAAFWLSRQAYPLLARAAQEGENAAIVHVASVHAVATSANIAAYAASKGALLALTRAMAIEWAPAGIRVNAVLPGAVDTPMLRAGLARGHLAAHDVDAQLAELAQRTVIGRVAQPHEIARIIYVLADDHWSSFVTGAGWLVDGGATARLSTE
ncbi:MAG: SDR family oxidoreductase [Chloroflexi bacterium]|nr:SDR family oxidoreductase [Chloroflexota bacterium]